MKKILTISILIICMISCENTSQTEIISSGFTNDSCKYWLIYFKNPNKPYNMGYHVCKNGTYSTYTKSDRGERIYYQPYNNARPI